MAGKFAVAIGVNQAGSLPVLSGAVSGAQKFGMWATAQGFTVVSVTDDAGAVTLSGIKTAIAPIVNGGVCSQLIVFFSGHGILRGQEWEVWLLSGAPLDADEAVNVSGSVALARNSGIPHVVFISDCCRTRPDSQQMMGIYGGVIFPNIVRRKTRPSIDQFYATLPGDPAFEAPENSRPTTYNGIFTACMLDGLSGQVHQVITDRGSAASPRWVIESAPLGAYLESEVPKVASKLNIRLQQDPEVRPESHPPKYLAEVPLPLVGGVALGPTAPAPFPDQPQPAMQVRGYTEPVASAFRTAAAHPVRTDPRIVESFELIEKSKGRQSFETQTGFTIIGADIERAIVTGSPYDVFTDHGSMQIRVRDIDLSALSNKTLLVQFRGDGSGATLAVLPGFVGTVIVQNHRILTVNYTPSGNSKRYEQYKEAANQIDFRRALMAAHANLGALRFASERDARFVESHLRTFNGLDPTLSLYAAYAFAQAGMLEEVDFIYDTVAASGYIPFDVALLAGKLPNSEPLNPSHGVTPFCPMLTQGWAYLESYPDILTGPIRDARNHQLSSLWTSFDSQGVEVLWHSMDQARKEPSGFQAATT